MSAYWLRDSRLPRSPHYALPAQKMFLCVEMELNMIREFVANLRLLVPGFRATCLAWRRVHSLRRLFSAAVCLLLAVATSTAASPEKTPTNLTPSAISPCISTSVCVTIPGSPLTINVGAQFNYQIYNSDVPGGVGQYYPNDRVLADSGWIVRFSGTNYGFPVSTNSSAGGVGIVGALSSISGGGDSGHPLPRDCRRGVPRRNWSVRLVNDRVCQRPRLPYEIFYGTKRWRHRCHCYGLLRQRPVFGR